MNAQNIFVDKSDFFYQIAPIYNFKQSIVSLTFDDGYVTQFTDAMPILKKMNIPATFYIITESLDSISKSLLNKNLSNNFEIGSHTEDHADLVKIGNIEAEKELFDSKIFLQKEFGINSGLTMSYPWGIYNSSIKQLAKTNYLAARSANIGYNSLHALDRYALYMQNFDNQIEVSKANNWIDFAIKNQLWLIEMIHGCD
ncbi:MAG: polysaccharide deacetylase family protein [Bacteroidia bacterium]|nr:polysaccharide deacetylase family protein [Bacteroidia bacterium]